MKKIEKTSLCVLCTLLLHCAAHSAYGQNTNYPYITEYDGDMLQKEATITFDSEPQGARVIVNNKAYGYTPLTAKISISEWYPGGRYINKANQLVNETKYLDVDQKILLSKTNIIEPRNKYIVEKSTILNVQYCKEGYKTQSQRLTNSVNGEHPGGYPSDVFMVLEKDPDAVAQVPATVNSNTSVAQNTNVTQQQVNTNNVSNTTTYNLSNGSQSGNNQMSNQSQSDMLNRSIRFNIDSTPRGARVFWRVISSITNEVSGSNEMWLGNTPIEVNRTFNIPGLTYENSRHIQIEIKVRQNGYIDQTRTFNLRQAIDMQDISAYYDLVPAQ